jgi:hypothetical protein
MTGLRTGAGIESRWCEGGGRVKEFLKRRSEMGRPETAKM